MVVDGGDQLLRHDHLEYRPASHADRVIMRQPQKQRPSPTDEIGEGRGPRGGVTNTATVADQARRVNSLMPIRESPKERNRNA